VTSTPPTTQPIDGRVARSQRTREAVADALLSLLEEGDLRATAARIAERAGVGLRSVFHHFEDLDSLYAVVSERQHERMRAMTRRISATLPLDERVAAFVAQRARVLEFITPVRRAALLYEHTSQELAKRLRAARRLGRREVEVLFGPELEAVAPGVARETLEALTAAASWPAWEALRSHRRLSRQDAEAVMLRTVRALLKEAGVWKF
jgi:AcrR family transcriptional regulator